MTESWFDYQARREIVEAAWRYTRHLQKLGETIGLLFALESNTLSEPRIATGHQPILPHSGIVQKYRILQERCLAGGQWGLSLVIDTDEGAPLDVPIPVGSQEHPESVQLLPQPACLFCAAPMWTAAQRQHVQSILKRSGMQGPLIESLQTTELMTWPEWVIVVRKSLLKESAVLDLPLTQLCQVSSVQAWMQDRLRDAPRLYETVNEALVDYRRMHHICNQANPFPNLKQTDTAWEAPFWQIEAGQRRPLWMPKDGFIPPKTQKVVTKSMMTMAMIRYGLVEQFIHGRGGAHYDAVTDNWVSRYAGFSPRSFETVSADRYLYAPAVDLKRLATGHPERLTGLIAESTHRAITALHQQKMEQVAALCSAAGRAERKRLGVAIKALDRQIETCVPDQDEIEVAARGRRDYPFFYFN